MQAIKPTSDLEQAHDDLAQEGVAIIEGVLDDQEVEAIRARVYRGIELSEADGVPTRGYAFDPDRHNRRLFHLFNLDPVFIDLIQRDVALRYVRQLLGEDFLISNFSANITEPGNAPMQLHADQGYVLPPWPETPLACNVAWLLDDLSEENGATRYVPGSHRHGHGPDPDETYDTTPVLAPAGSILLMDGRLWHQTGTNRSDNQQRVALFGYYVRRWLRPQINWNAALWPETVNAMTPEFLHLLGYYSGNVEFQVPNGERASVRAPEPIRRQSDAFALGPAQ